MSEPRLSGGTAFRRWRISHDRGTQRVEVWSPWPVRVAVASACTLGVVTAYLAVALAVRAGLEISAWVVATLYVLTVVFLSLGTLLAVGRERLAVRPHDLLLERFVLFSWRHTRLERVPDVAIGARRGRSMMAVRMLEIATPERSLGFGAWLSPVSAETIAAQVREALSPADAPTRSVHDGVARRVATLDGDNVIPGAAHLLVLEGRKATRGNVDRLFGRTLPGGMAGPLVLVVLLLVLVGPTVGFEAVAGGVLIAAVVALILVEGGVVEFVRRVRLRRHADEPWRAPRCWRTSVLRVSALQRSVMPGLLAVTALGLSVWIWLASGSTTPGLASVVFGLVATAALWRLQNVVFMGATEVRLRHMPYWIGEDVVLDFAVSQRGGHFEDVSFVLARLVEVKRGARAPLVAASHIARFSLPADQPPPGPGEQVTARFFVPSTASGTRLHPDRPAIWELLVTGTTSCGAYSEAFPIPIFDPAPAAALAVQDQASRTSSSAS